MDATAVLVIVAFALVAIGALVVFQQKARVEIKGPFNTGLTVDGSNETPATPPDLFIKNMKSAEGGFLLDQEPAEKTAIEGVEVKDDILINRKATPPGPAPKA
jgi:hypothetical protein